MQRRDIPTAEKISWLLFLLLAGTTSVMWLYFTVSALMRA